MSKMDIAIIGLSSRFPNSPTLAAFAENLKQGQDLVRPLSYQRISRTGIPFLDYQALGYLEDIDMFDYHFFGLSRAEAESMDPHQRLLLEVVYETFESSGYSIDYFNGSETGVFLGDVDLEYYKHAKQFDPSLITGNLNSAIAGRIARYFNLRGSAQMIDSSCSSSLTALYHACNELELGNLDQALVGGANLILFPQSLNETIRGIESEDGKSRAFSIDASGTGSGEAVCAILLKPLKKAREDNDLIHAIIKSVSVNQDGAMSANLTAPDAVAQSQVISKALRKAGVSPSTITYIEAHGTGTKLGDPIEIDGITRAFSNFTIEKEYCAISSVKSNIGHTNSVAGLAGLIKVVLSFKNKSLYPSLHCERLNPLIDFSNSPVYVNTSLREWTLPDTVPVRRASLSSFGFMGTNAHAILEESLEYRSDYPEKEPSLFAVSAQSYSSLINNLTNLRQYIQSSENLNLLDVSYTLLTGRKHYDHRFVCSASDVSILLDKINLTIGSPEPLIKKSNQRTGKLIFLFSGKHQITHEQLENLSASFKDFNNFYRQCFDLSHHDQWQNDNVLTFVFYYCFYGFLCANGLTPQHLIGDGVGKICIDAINKKSTLQEAILRAEGFNQNAGNTDVKDRLVRAIQSIGDIGVMTFLECGNQGILSKILSSIAPGNVFHFAGNEYKGVLNLFSEFYLSGYRLNWNHTFLSRQGKRIQLPTYAFDRSRCWLSDLTSFDSSQWYYQIDWKKTDLDRLSKRASEMWLFVHESDEAYLETKKSFNNNDIHVKFGDCFKVLNDSELIIDIHDENPLLEVFRYLNERGLKIENLAYTFPSKSHSAKHEFSIQRYFLIVKGFCKEWSAQPFSLVTFTYEALAIADKDLISNCYQSLVHGLNIALTAEYPHAKIRCIDLDPISAPQIESIFSNEIGMDDSLVSLGYREGNRFCRVLNKMPYRPKANSMHLKRGGVYIVTGGASGIGLEIVKRLAVQQQVKIIVIGKRKLPVKQDWYSMEPTNAAFSTVQAFLNVEKHGSQLFYFSANLGDSHQVSSVMDEITKEHGPVNGVVHSAGVPGSYRLERHNWETFSETLDAKVSGTTTLCAKLDPDDLSFFVLFSSLNSLVGVERGTNYSAANCFLDNYVRVLRKKGFRAHVINWTSWKETGMWQRANQGDDDDQESLLNLEGIAVLEDVLSSRYENIIISKTDPLTIPSRSYVLGEMGSTTSVEMNQLANDTYLSSGIEVEDMVRTIWLETLKVSSIQQTDDFFELGGHSLTALKLIIQVEKKFNVKLEISDILECSSFDKMCTMVNKLVEKNRHTDSVIDVAGIV